MLETQGKGRTRKCIPTVKQVLGFGCYGSLPQKHFLHSQVWDAMENLECGNRSSMAAIYC